MKQAIGFALLLPILASANDSVGGVKAGGIVLRNTDAIAMKKEVLTINHRLISVDYEFVNESANDVDETVVFPLPAYPATPQPYETYYGQPAGFSITADGKNVGFHTVVQAFLNGVDISTQLRKLGLSDAQIAYNASFDRQLKVAALSTQQQRQLVQQKLIAEGPTGETGPTWEVRVSYVWQQKFPANKVVRVHHAYRPFVAAGPGESGMDADTAKRYCADPAFLKSWKKLARRASGPDGEYLSPAKVAYILKTGNNWKRGIEDFTLNIVKSDPSELSSPCFPGTFNKIDAKTYQVRLRNFRPSSDLDVYFGNVNPSEDSHDGRMPLIRK